MRNKTLRLLILAVQFIVTLAMLGACIQVFSLDSDWFKHIEFAECFIRLICISAFTLFYYHSFVRGFESDTLFIPLFLLFSVLTETRIISIYSKMFGYYVLPPLEIVNIFIFSTIMTVIPLIGYCLFYDNLSSDGAFRFLIAGIAGSIIITDFVPKPQNFSEIWNYTAIKLPIYAVYLIAFAACIIMLLTDRPGSDFSRHVACLIFIISNFINLFFNTFVMNIIGTVFLFIACLIIIVITNRNAIKM